MYYVPGIIQLLYILILTTDCEIGTLYYLAIVDEGNGAQKGSVTCPRPHSSLEGSDVIGVQHISSSVHVPNPNFDSESLSRFGAP